MSKSKINHKQNNYLLEVIHLTIEKQHITQERFK